MAARSSARRRQGQALFANCRITDPAGRPLAGVEVDVWQASPVGLYENQDPTQADMNLRGKFTTDADGRLWFRSVKPAGYPVPTDGPVGDLLRAQRRHPYRPAHLHFLGYKPGFKTLITQVFVDDDEHLESDVVFGVTRHLIGDFRRGRRRAAGTGRGWSLVPLRLRLRDGSRARRSFRSRRSLTDAFRWNRFAVPSESYPSLIKELEQDQAKNRFPLFRILL